MDGLFPERKVFLFLQELIIPKKGGFVGFPPHVPGQPGPLVLPDHRQNPVHRGVAGMVFFFHKGEIDPRFQKGRFTKRRVGFPRNG